MNNYKSLQVWMNDKKVGTLAMAAGYSGNCNEELKEYIQNAGHRKGEQT